MNTKSVDDFTGLIGVLIDPKFALEDIRDFAPRHELKKLDDYAKKSGAFLQADRWRMADIEIALLKPRKTYASEADAPPY